MTFERSPPRRPLQQVARDMLLLGGMQSRRSGPAAGSMAGFHPALPWIQGAKLVGHAVACRGLGVGRGVVRRQVILTQKRVG